MSAERKLYARYSAGTTLQTCRNSNAYVELDARQCANDVQRTNLYTRTTMHTQLPV